MIRPILKLGAPELEKVCTPVTDFDEDLRNLVRDMFETMYAAPGVGLAAPQIGVDLRLIVMDVRGGEEEGHQIVMANPEIAYQEGRQREEEGCLSIPDFTAVVERPYLVKVSGQDIDGNRYETVGEGILARAFCHEIDHINGVLYIDRISAFRRDLIRRKIRKLMKAGEW
ncbi:MAG: peptide deformylase [Acidobacteria bacterium]|nr:MAG: peptide deformylase [Acidobacteriota bacterium]